MGISSKSDFQDHCEMFNDAWNIINNYDVYVGSHDIVPLKFREPKDLLPYYPFLVGMMFSSEGTGKIILGDRSFIDIEEEEWLSHKLEAVMRIYRRCKRKHIPFDKEAAKTSICLFARDDLLPHEAEIINRVEKYGDKATIDNLHDPVHDRMRNEWYQLMTDGGWSEDEAYRWIYGWTRWLEWRKNQDDKDSEGLDGENNNSNSKD